MLEYRPCSEVKYMYVHSVIHIRGTKGDFMSTSGNCDHWHTGQFGHLKVHLCVGLSVIFCPVRGAGSHPLMKRVESSLLRLHTPRKSSCHPVSTECPLENMKTLPTWCSIKCFYSAEKHIPMCLRRLFQIPRYNAYRPPPSSVSKLKKQSRRDAP